MIDGSRRRKLTDIAAKIEKETNWSHKAINNHNIDSINKRRNKHSALT